MDAALISNIAGISLSLAFAYVPGLEAWFKNLQGNYKRLVMGGFLLLASVSVFLYSCRYSGPVTCDESGLVEMVRIFISALIANQTVYSVLPKEK